MDWNDGGCIRTGWVCMVNWVRYHQACEPGNPWAPWHELLACVRDRWDCAWAPADGNVNQRGRQQDLSSPAQPRKQDTGLQADRRRTSSGRDFARIWGTGWNMIRKETSPSSWTWSPAAVERRLQIVWVPFRGLKLDSCLTLRNELSKETHVLTKQEILLGKGAQVESSRVREPRRTALPCGLQSRVSWPWD